MADDEKSGIGDMLGDLAGRAMSGEYSGGRTDTYTEVTEVGWFQRIFGSFFSGLFGLAIFLGSFVVLYMNEGSVDESKLAVKAQAINAEAPSGGNGKFVAASGPLKTDAMLGDDYLKEGNYITLSRDAEMYAWVENKHETTEKKVGGGEKKVTTYDYKREWTSSPSSSSSFKVQAGHHNPTMTIKGGSWKADAAAIGKLNLNVDKVTLPGGSKVDLSDENTKGGDVQGEYLYVGGANAGRPAVGDIRLSYSALEPGGKYTAFGKLDGTNLSAAKVGDRDFYRVFAGSKEDALKQLSFEYSLWIWGFRLLGFLMCWGGMRMMMEPLNTVLDVLPFLGSMGRGLTGFITFPIALVMSGVTILISQIMHNLFLMILVGVLVLVGGVVMFGRKKATGSSQQAAA